MAIPNSNQVFVITSASRGTGLITVLTAADVGGKLVVSPQSEPVLKFAAPSQLHDTRH